MTATQPSPRFPPALAGGLTFLAAGAVLVLEIAAGRLLAPYVGVSLTTYTGIIGVVLAGISLGAWAGGQLADRQRPERLIGPTLALGGLAAMTGVPLVRAVGELGLGTDPVAIVTLAAVGFVAPAAILSAAAPMIVRASLTQVASSGSVVGRLSAIGTAGAIAGTFLTGFVLLGLVPTRLLVLATGALLVVVGALVTLATSRRGTRLGGAGRATWVALAGALVLSRVAAGLPEPCDRESAYFCMQVVADPAEPDGRTLVLDRVRHAYVDLADPTRLEFRYERWFADAAAEVLARTPGLDVLHVGGGGFTFPRYLLAVDTASRHTILELDSEVVEVAEDELGLDASAFDIRVGDARTAFRDLGDGAFHLVVGDAFAGLSVPWHLTTRELLLEIDRVLVPDGRYVMNLIDGPELRFARAETATFRSVWPHVAVVVPSAALEGAGGSNVVLIGSPAPIDGGAIRARLADRTEPATELLASAAELDGFAKGSVVLTDDFAPVDQLLIR